MGRKGGCQQVLEQPALGTRFHAHPVFFQNHIALFIELPEDRMQKALRFQKKPQLDPVGRQAVVVFGRIVVGPCIHAGTAVLLDQARIFIRDDEGLRPVDGLGHLLVECADFLRIGLRSFVLLGLQAVVGGLNGVQSELLIRPVRGADHLGALKSHVLEHVSNPGRARRVVDRSGVHVGMKGNHRRLMPLGDDEMQAVG